MERRLRSDAQNSVSSIDILKEVEKVKVVVDVVDWRFYSTGVCICLLNLVAAWDATSLSVVLPIIASDLGGSAVQSIWLVLSFLLAAAVCSPLFATLSTIFGRKPLLLTALTLLTCGSFITAVSGRLAGLHLGRTVQGMGAGGIAILSSLIVSDLASAEDRRKWTGILGTMWAIGAVTGPMIGDGLANRSMFRWVFWINLPFCLIAFLILPFFAQLKSASPGAMLPKLKNVDWLGFFLLSGSLVSVLLGLTAAGTNYSWSSFRTILPLQFGCIGLVIFVTWSWFSPFASMISIRGLDITTLITSFCSLVLGTIVFAVLYFLPLYFIVAKPNHSLVGAGIRLLPTTMPLAFFSLLTFFLLNKTKYIRPAIWTAWVLVLISVSLMVLFTRKSGSVVWALAFFSGSGVGVLYPSLHMSSHLTTPEAVDPTTTVTNFTFAQFLGQTFGVAFGFAIFQNEFLTNLTKEESFEYYITSYVQHSTALVTKIPRGEDGSNAAAMADIFVNSLRPVWIVMAAFAGLALVASAFMKEKEVAQSVVPDLNVDQAYVV
ncbi:MFS general substrate transporter [Pleomassaria siparia CBS 279.74]|uniref:MFS general substrate transporter n=1 Tax=Pleomassaria siparia CBS 279.74 TaxID=1314801 RepID=A0A6G1KHR9_9PLEO|nr:MFS general substrate transporter [Pleomassaria siparia CBS 279.74]